MFIDAIRNDIFNPNKPLRVHEVECISLLTGQTVARYTGLKILRDQGVRTLLTQVLPRAGLFNPTATDNGTRLEVRWEDQNFKWWIYGTQRS